MKFFKVLVMFVFGGVLFVSGVVYVGMSDCVDGSVLLFIDQCFDYKVSWYLQVNFDILGFDKVLNIYVDYCDEIYLIECVYCYVKVDMNDGWWCDFWYMIESGMGYVGFGEWVCFCILGLDFWYVDGC